MVDGGKIEGRVEVVELTTAPQTLASNHLNQDYLPNGVLSMKVWETKIWRGLSRREGLY